MIRNTSGLVVSFRRTYVARSLFSDSEQASSSPLRQPHSHRPALQEQRDAQVKSGLASAGHTHCLEQHGSRTSSLLLPSLKYGSHCHGSRRQAPPLRAERARSQSHPQVHHDPLGRAVLGHDKSYQGNTSMCWKIKSNRISLQSFLLRSHLSPVPSLLSDTSSHCN